MTFRKGDVVRFSPLGLANVGPAKPDRLGVVTGTPRDQTITVPVRWDVDGGARVRKSVDRIHRDYLELVELSGEVVRDQI